ncbi:MAG: glycerol-3-phosphate 1-O-acyltransferase PlsY [Parvibaculaceae bacterium]|nr:glycerol-3-phosphate 1-O-acyltransferase PlsY [Parvibaculaceae bacterium]
MSDIGWTFPFLEWAIALVGGYFLGSIPFGLILTNLAGLGDIRSIGSGNIGATNALRTGNKWVAIGTLIGDAAKGAIAVILAIQLSDHAEVASIAAIGAFLGHLYPIWLKFKGGKGISTFIGLLLALYWPVGLLFCLTWLATAAVFRMSSLAALVAAAATPIYLAWLGQMQFVILSCVLTALIYLAHRDNIKRLLAGTEPRIGDKKTDTSDESSPPS